MKFKLNKFPILGGVLLTAVLLFFRVPVSILLDKLLVSPLFAYFEGGAWADLFFIIILLIVSGWLAKEQSLIFICRGFALGILFYLFQKANNYWDFNKLVLLPMFAYWDLVALSGMVTIPLFFLFEHLDQSLSPSETKVGFIEDDPVILYENDHFKRKIAATEIASLILRTNNKKSFAIGILGQYGSGKTSFLNLINLALVDKNVLPISFDPWSVANPDMIRREFFDLLADKVATIDMKMSSLVYSYGRKLAGIDGRSQSWFKWFGFFRRSDSAQSSAEYAQINEMLKATGRKVIITIDDLDRLYAPEIIEVLKLIRNTANFFNVVYLVGYDKGYVQSAIGTLNGNAKNYLDKIFQLEIPLPKYEKDDLLVGLQGSLKKMLSEEHYYVFENTIIPNGFRNRYEKAYVGILRQNRDVVRFLNSFKIAYNLIGKEVDFQCLLLLELIKFRFPDIYELIYSQSDKFLFERSFLSTHEQFYSPFLVKQEDVKNKTEDVTVFKTYLEKLEFGDEEVSILDGLFRSLFNGSEYKRPEQKNSISYPLYFEIYFRYRLSNYDLSNKEYQQAKTLGGMQEFMSQCANVGLHKELMVRFLQEDITKDRRHFEQVLIWVFSFGRTFVEKEGMFRFDYEGFLTKISNYHNYISDSLYKKDKVVYGNFINDLFSNALPPFLFENELIFRLKEKSSEFVLSKEKLTNHQYSYFTRMAESGHGLSKDTLWLFWGARKYYNEGAQDDNEWQFEDSMITKMKVYLATKDSKEFLKFSINRALRDRSLCSIYPQVMEMFDDPTEYRELVRDNPELAEGIKIEYLEFFDKLALKNFKGVVEMEFQTEIQKMDD
ncbi:KAP family P-loop NTPase fold protein [Algoriphagus aquimarinus]|uniref:KAP family P-loop domain-containing protein n=1 Tax=Algoriphagus aquimarinus TaxID=237018 RepID=A0A1I1BKD6_9BACT|nr:P-loop NTPase fold protein [Algoriphagus aquimarinus]SFB50721.1 KAP family P-loop domain-containing protein [Algoriphagus aquimarinus]